MEKYTIGEPTGSAALQKGLIILLLCTLFKAFPGHAGETSAAKKKKQLQEIQQQIEERKKELDEYRKQEKDLNK
ncbi:MAG: hypothetical protein ABIG11_04630, partial [bacterium]